MDIYNFRYQIALLCNHIKSIIAVCSQILQMHFTLLRSLFILCTLGNNYLRIIDHLIIASLHIQIPGHDVRFNRNSYVCCIDFGLLCRKCHPADAHGNCGDSVLSDRQSGFGHRFRPVDSRRFDCNLCRSVIHWEKDHHFSDAVCYPFDLSRLHKLCVFQRRTVLFDRNFVYFNVLFDRVVIKFQRHGIKLFARHQVIFRLICFKINRCFIGFPVDRHSKCLFARKCIVHKRKGKHNLSGHRHFRRNLFLNQTAIQLHLCRLSFCKCSIKNGKAQLIIFYRISAAIFDLSVQRQENLIGNRHFCILSGRIITRFHITVSDISLCGDVTAI